MEKEFKSHSAHGRALKILQKIIAKLNLDLTSMIVLTEVGSGNYVYTPIIPALAGAKKVYAWTRDSVYGKGDQNREQCIEIASYCDISEKIEIVVNEQPINHIKTADIITNSGFLRPLNKKILKNTKKTCVIPLMYEAWELRKRDIDIAYCKDKGIKVAGTWESHPDISVFDAIGALCVKLALAAGFEIHQNNIIVWSNDLFGAKAAEAFRSLGAQSVRVTSSADEVYKNLEELDFLFLCAYNEHRQYFGAEGIFDLTKLKMINSTFGVVHLVGGVDNDELIEHGIDVYPNRRGYPMQMSETLGYLGLTPILNLLAAGFKVAEYMINDELSSIVQPITY